MNHDVKGDKDIEDDGSHDEEDVKKEEDVTV